MNYDMFYRFRILSQCKNKTGSGVNTIYDSLSLSSSANVDNTKISSNYSTLSMNNFQSQIDNRRLDETHIMPLSTISTVLENNTMSKETDRNTNRKRSEYENLVF